MKTLTYEVIWLAIDGLAARNNLTPSGLAKKAGLDPTTFNKSKRVNPSGVVRWPSTESIVKILQATDTSVFDFFGSAFESDAPSAGYIKLDENELQTQIVNIIAGDEFPLHEHLEKAQKIFEIIKPYAEAQAKDRVKVEKERLEYERLKSMFEDE